jgi:nucleoid-associated protein YgaU
VALASPDKPTVLLSNPDRPPAPPEPPAARGPNVAAAPAPGAPADPAARRPEPPTPAPAPRPPVRIAAIDAEDGGRLFVSGQAAPGATVRLYLNDTLIAPGGAGADGKVGFAISRGVRPGGYRVRLDDVDPVSGEVRSRAEVQFAMPAQVAVPLPPQVPPMVTGPQDVAGLAPAPSPHAPPAAAPGSAAAPGQAAAPAVPEGARAPGQAAAPAPPRTESATPSAAPQIAGAPGAGDGKATERAIAAGTVLIPEINTAIVARGDNLWNISRRIYGQGLRYTVIYGANQPQIRNPDLIYPGQVFVLPPEQAQAPRL